jgi:hypothetical protein
MPSFRVEQSRAAFIPAAEEELHPSSSLESSLSQLRLEAEEFVPTSSESGAAAASDIDGGPAPVRDVRLYDILNFYSLWG